jgi:hypothetical protein
MAQEFADKLLKAKEELERSRGEIGIPENGPDSEVDLDASTEIVPATEEFVSLSEILEILILPC